VLLDETEYWYRMINDGHSPLDSWPYAHEFSVYKEWVDGIERKALDTLLMCVNQLLLDTDKAEVYEGSLKGLQAFMGENKTITLPAQPKAAKENEALLGDQTRSLSDVSKALRNTLQNDAYLGKFFSEE